MDRQISFIGREKEVSLIDKLIGTKYTRYVICIHAAGGIGKSRLIREIFNSYSTSEIENLIVTEILDFDDISLLIPENMRRKISQMLGQEHFTSYLRSEVDYRKIQVVGVSTERLEEEKERVRQIFSDCFNGVSEETRIVLFFDTTDKFEEGKEIWQDLKTILPRLRNVIVLLAGRNAKMIWESLQPKVGSEFVRLIELKPLSERDSRLYLEEKEKIKHIETESDLADKLILLSGGIPILLDLAVEWRARGISLDWLVKSSLEVLTELSREQMENYQEEFKQQLVSHIKDLRSPMDELVLMMAHVYPLDVDMISPIANGRSAQELFEEAKEYPFVKQLPNNSITLHDLMRDMVNSYVWPGVTAKEDRRTWYSEQAMEHFKNKIAYLTIQINKLEHQMVGEEENTAFEISLRLEELEQQLWALKEQLLIHTLITNIENGIETFVEIFEEATKETRLALRQRFIDILQNCSTKLSKSQICILDFHRGQQTFANGEFDITKKSTEELLKRSELSIELKIDTLLLKGNAEIRLGEVRKGILDFTKAVKACEENNLKLLEIKSKNALGWAHRLTGDLDQAQRFYREARNLCLEEGGPDRKELTEVYGQLLNNYAFVLSNENRTRKAAIDTAHTAIEHWKKTANDIGLGAGYLVLGIVYYRSDLSELAFDAFQKALNIFEPLRLNDWIGQIYSWRGAQFFDIEEYHQAERDFKKSLEIGAVNIKAMTLNRLSRIYMNRHEWDLAEKTMLESLDYAKRIPDYIYWLGSIARLISIAAKKGESHRLVEFKQQVEECEKEFNNPDKNSIGIAYLGLAKLAFLQNDHSKIPMIVDFLKRGIPLVVEHGSHARTDIITRLAIIEEDFHLTDSEIIRNAGQDMKDFIYEKESENINYSTALEIMFKWANWKGKN